MPEIDFSGWAGDAAVSLVFIVLVVVPVFMIPACQRLIARMETEGR